MGDVLKVIGMMSGTSLDGVDAALVETDGEAAVRPGRAITVPYSDDVRRRLKEALALAAMLPRDAPAPPVIGDLARGITEMHAAVIERLLKNDGLRPRDIDLVGFHGQTILHRPSERRTWQIGDGSLLAALTGIAVVNDFRTADVAAGGAGAPFVPLYHAALARMSVDLVLPVAIINIGGVANVTYLGKQSVLAFDTGPGNAPIDDWAYRHTGVPLDVDGRLASSGKVDGGLLARMLRHDFFEKPPPKSLDRLDFRADGVKGLSAADGAATLTSFTAASVARAAEHFPEPASTWIICGGGRHNPALMTALTRYIDGPVKSAEAMGWRGDFIEAEAFGYLAVRSINGLPLSLPTTTGVPCPTTGGRLHRPAI